MPTVNYIGQFIPMQHSYTMYYLKETLQLEQSDILIEQSEIDFFIHSVTEIDQQIAKMII